MKKHKYVCEECGSDDLSFDANVEWDMETQSYTVNDVWCSYCRNCGEENITLIKYLLNDNILVL
jgi:YgiT-type zinc finger domain-containing protein